MFTYIWCEAAWVFSAALLPAPVVAPALAAGVVLALVLLHKPLNRIAFNSASTLLAGMTGWLMMRAVSAGATHPDPRFYAGLVVGGLAMAAAQNVLTNFVVAAAEGESLWSVVRSHFLLDILEATAQVGFSVGSLVIALWWQEVLVLVPAGLLLLSIVNRVQLRLRQSEEHSRQLDHAVRSLNQLDERAVLDALVRGAGALLSAHLVEAVSADDPDNRAVWSRSLGEQRAVGVVEEREVAFGDERLGLLRLSYLDEVTLDSQEQRVLSTLVSAAGVAVLNARRHAAALQEATHDPLTGLANRRALLGSGGQRLPDGGAALLLLDLDRFKEVNDTLGHTEGDMLLQQIADRVERVVINRQADRPPTTDQAVDPLIARLGGDEFAVLLPGCDGDTAALTADRLVEAVGQPALVGGLTLAVGSSIGVATAPACGTTVEALLRCADIAMYQAKRAGGGVQLYDAGSDAGAVERLLFEPELRATLLGSLAEPGRQGGDLTLVFQPQFDLATGAPAGAEALTRWRHPVLGILRPEAFMPVVERAGLHRALIMRTLDAALVARAEWHAENGVNLPVSVNLSARDLLDVSLPCDVVDRLRAHRTDPSRLVLEVPEAIVATEIGVIATVLRELHDVGVRLSLDGFGRGGGAPLTLLAQVPIDEIKIDGSLIGRMAQDEVAATIVRSTVGLGHSLGLRTVALGVEQIADPALLLSAGCDLGQGYRFARSLGAAETGQLFAERAASALAAADADVIPLPLARRR